MSETTKPDPQEWVWQGWFGPMADAAVAKAMTDIDSRAGVWVPLPGDPPARVDLAGTMGMWAVQTRRSAPIPLPDGVMEADPAIVGRLVGA